MARRKRRHSKPTAPKPAGLRDLRIPPWLFYTLAAIFGTLVAALMFWGMLQQSLSGVK